MSSSVSNFKKNHIEKHGVDTENSLLLVKFLS